MPNLSTSLYRPEFEHDACGVGFVARTTGQAGHDILEMALEGVGCMKHRAGVDADGLSGDGAGVLTQLPHRLLADEIVDLPAPGDYALGVFFLSKGKVDVASRIIEKCVAAALQPYVTGQQHPASLISWRLVPLNPDSLGYTARKTCPKIRQLIIRRPAALEQGRAFERLLYTLRKQIKRASDQANLDREDLYITSLSSLTVVYKGLMLSPNLAAFYLDLTDPRFETALAVFHTRYSTNTTSTWSRAQPFRQIAHNGEINTIQGNVNWMRARESTLTSPYWPNLWQELSPIVGPGGSDSAMLDNVLELLVHAGRDIHHAMAMLAPEAWENLGDMHADRRAFYRYHAALMEPWDGPAGVVFSDGHKVGATLDRNGLRPMRYLTTTDNLVVATSETGVITVDEGKIATKGKLGPGQMILVDLPRQVFLTNDQVKGELARRPQYAQWVSGFKPLYTESRPAYFSLSRDNQRPAYAQPKVNTNPQWLTRLHVAFGYTSEEITVIVRPMGEEGKEPTGSMGDDSALAVLSPKPRPLFHYFKQRFAQVTNPPIDPLRETFVMSLTTRLGTRRNLLEETAEHAHLIELTSPVLSDTDLAALKGVGDPRFQAHTVPMRYPVEQREEGLKRALDRLCKMAEAAIDNGKTIVILSDLGIDAQHAPIPSLLAVGAVHHHLVRQGRRMQVSLVVETGEVREVHHLACLIGYGANAVNPYLALATVEGLVEAGKIKLPVAEAKINFVKALEAGLLKVMSKMGISTVDSYCGAQIFEAVGLGPELIEPYFTGTVSRLGGISLAEIAAEMYRWHEAAFADPENVSIQSHGFYKFRRGGELHAFDPANVKALHTAVRWPNSLSEGASQTFNPGPTNGKGRVRPQPRSFVGEKFDEGYNAFKKFGELTRHPEPIGPRDMFGFVDNGRSPLPLAEVEPLESIFMRFSTAAMSHGALSSEAHETLAIAMNRLGAMSNSGEGGSAQARIGTERNDRAKQVASGRFGVTPAYLVSADELQIKMAQGAKPGEGGQLPGSKVTAEIAAIRHTTEGTTLISPPPHHDIYSIEDLAQLIYDLKQINPSAAVSVKLVSVAGVGTIAAGVAKGGADVVHIAGHAGGTGAAAWSSIKNVGLPWEIGLAETHQTLTMNHLRDKIRVRTDGGLQTGRDIIIAAILGADEFSFGTAALVAEGCLMARACHSNTCPVGVATQNPALRAKFAGTAEHVMAYMHYVAHEVREILAQLGFRSLADIVGHTELLAQRTTGTPIFDSLDLSPLLTQVELETKPTFDHQISSLTAMGELNLHILKETKMAVESGELVKLTLSIGNEDRTVGASLAGAIALRCGDAGLPDETIDITFNGSAGQSFGAFNVGGVSLTLNGEANDYVGKGMSGGQIVIRPSLKSQLVAGDNVIMGNTVLYGATGGSLFAAGQAGERFAVRNSGAQAVVEGVGDHGCEYMTGGVVVVLGRTGYNFGAGMSGGIAFVLDEGRYLPQRLNSDMVQLVRITNQHDVNLLKYLITKHIRLTGSVRGQAVLEHWAMQLGHFWKVAPKGTIGAGALRSSDQVSTQVLELSKNVVG